MKLQNNQADDHADTVVIGDKLTCTSNDTSQMPAAERVAVFALA
jgi:hypothetical protein